MQRKDKSYYDMTLPVCYSSLCSYNDPVLAQTTVDTYRYARKVPDFGAT